jgi:hypothetical protein
MYRLHKNLLQTKRFCARLIIYKCVCEISLTLREEYRLRMFENRVLTRIFGPKRVEVTREWRKLHNEELLHQV